MYNNVNLLSKLSTNAQEFAATDREVLIGAYTDIALVYARHEARKGYRQSAVRCPAFLIDDIRKRLEAEGLGLSETGKNFYGNKLTGGCFLIQW